MELALKGLKEIKYAKVKWENTMRKYTEGRSRQGNHVGGKERGEQGMLK